MTVTHLVRELYCEAECVKCTDFSTIIRARTYLIRR